MKEQKKIKNKPKINKEITFAELPKLVEQLKENLKKKLIKEYNN